jgi:class 3 adenylate cyclase
MLKNILIIIFAAIILSSCSNENRKEAPKAVKGVLDLRNWDFEKDGIIKLDGEWEFYWQQFLASKDFDTIKSKHYINVPDTWKGYEWDKNTILPGAGFVSYKLKLIVSKNSKDLALKILNMGTAYKLYINDSFYGSNGKAGKTKEESEPQFLPKVYEINNNKDTLYFNINVSNFEYRTGGIWNSLEFGNKEKIVELKDRNIVLESIISGSFFIVFLYFLMLFVYINKDRVSFIWCIISLCAALRMIVTGEIIVLKLIPEFPWENIIRIELGTFYLVSFLFLLYFNELFINLFSKVVVKIVIFYHIPLIILTIFISPKLLSILVPYQQVIVVLIFIYIGIICIKAAKRKLDGSYITLISQLIYFAAIINAILYNKNIINSFDSGGYGGIVFLILQAVLLSQRLSKAIKRIENFAKELEITVKERTKELRNEKDKSDKLLLNVLPESIATRLKSGETQIADHFEEASVIFIDIADFTVLSSKSTPQAMVKMLNEIFTIFDKIAAKYGLEKIKTIGDCYMAAAGIPIPRSDHAEAIAMMALEVMETMKGFRVSGIGNRVLGIGYSASGIGDSASGIGDRVSGISEESFSSQPLNPIPNTQNIQFRIGLDCGPIVAGVIGEQKFIYDLWGDMVNTASRMESNGVVGKIQCTERFKDVLHLADVGHLINFEERGMIEIKGKGMMRTYFLSESQICTD